MLDVSADEGKFTRCIRLVIADRQPIVLQGLTSIFAAQHDFEIVASCRRGTSCLDAIRNLAPDVALVANTLPDLTVSEILAIAKAENLPTRLVFFAEPEGDDDLIAAIAAGTCSAISNYAHPDTILRSLRLMTERTSARPKPSQDLSPNGKELDRAKIEKMLRVLTLREREIIRLVAEGLSNKEIARQLNVSPGTVKVHLYNIFQKLEISNRTVLATIALSQRSTGFGTLSLAALAFAILSDIKTSDANSTFLDEDSTASKDLEHSAFELWKKAILRHVIVADPGETVVLTQRSSPIKVNQVTHSAARMEELHAAEQAVLSNIGRGYGPIGSGTPHLFISPLLQAINQIGSPTAQQFPPLGFASNPVKSHGGYGAFSMMAAGVGIYTLDNSHAATQVLDRGEMLIDTSTVATLDGTTQEATITIHGASHVDPNDVDNLASGPVVHDSRLPLAFGHDSVTGEGNAGQIIPGVAGDDTLNGTGLVDVIYGSSGNDAIRDTGGDDTIYGGSGSDTINGNNGNDTIFGGYNGDQLPGSKDDDIFVYLSAIDSNCTQFDTIIDFTSGKDKINLAAFGALAFLHMTSASKSVPPHTLAWIYNPASNETIIYVNPTDRSLDIGDPGLLEIHLQGVVSVAESDFVYEREAAAVAAALEGIDPALLVATASDGTVLTAGSAEASSEAATSESTLVTAGIWTMPADDGLRFHFGRDRIGSIRLGSSDDDSAYATEESDDGAIAAPAHVSSIELAYSHATVLTEEHFTSKKEPVHANTGAVTTAPAKAHATAGFELPEFFALGNSGGHANAQHASNSPAAKASGAAEPTEPGATPGHSSSQHPSHAASAKALAAGESTEPGVTSGHGVGHSKSKHASNSPAAKASATAELTEPAAAPGHSNSQQPSHAASAKALAAGESTEPGVTSGHSVGPSKSKHASNSPAKASAATEPTEPGATPGHSSSHHPSHSTSAKALAAGESTEPGLTSGHGVGHSKSEHASNSPAAKASAATEPTEPGATPGHGSSQHPSHAASAKALAAGESTEPGVPSGNGVGHNNSHSSHSASASTMEAAEPVEPGVAPGNGGGHGNSPHASHSASAKPLETGELTEPGVTSGNGVGHNNSHSSHSASASTMEAAEPVEPGVAPGNGGGHGNSQHASHSAAAKASATGELTEAAGTPGQSNSQHPSHSASAKALAAAPQPAEPACGTGGAGHEPAFHFKDQAPPSTPTAAVELEELNDTPVLLVHGTELAAILKMGSAAMEEHATSHDNNGQHHSIAHVSHELLT
ncbi:LuxR C-terminal-related transcriptional regulator [Bradyrhizobium sp. sBnM-33]|uniref:LuxR C-terminal-related transcriptional regulator n=1 Tax=Bradyrhizobium sp. sBnM-33 TaxID=2831780 RepID=UPI001BCDC7CD|nr:LuxR C-terminal-related transcriptional regulator [Bradyrhizobium sp. sBnM-33]WOH51820.1 LuxR C-terminal-related transcriptional regulator [Bradyrhizobium sp. sBnM-33]